MSLGDGRYTLAEIIADDDYTVYPYPVPSPIKNCVSIAAASDWISPLTTGANMGVRIRYDVRIYGTSSDNENDLVVIENMVDTVMSLIALDGNYQLEGVSSPSYNENSGLYECALSVFCVANLNG